MNYKNLNAEYDKVVIFDLLSAEERSSLKITDDLEKIFKDKVSIEIHLCENKIDIVSKLTTLTQEARNGKKFIFHFVAHGNNQGIGFKHTNELVEWSIFSDHLTEINKAAGNSLILNLTSCFGLNGIKITDFISENTAFFGLIGYSQKLKAPKAITANQIFYTNLFKGISINEIVKIIRSEMKDENFHCITAQGYTILKKP